MAYRIWGNNRWYKNHEKGTPAGHIEHYYLKDGNYTVCEKFCTAVGGVANSNDGNLCRCGFDETKTDDKPVNEFTTTYDIGGNDWDTCEHFCKELGMKANSSDGNLCHCAIQ